MATVITGSHPAATESNNAGLVFGIILLLLVVLLFVFFGLPLLRGGYGTGGTSTGTQINVPGTSGGTGTGGSTGGSVPAK